MPILVRPVREQLEHDRVIRLLQAKYKRKFDVGINTGSEQTAPVGSGSSAIYPDLVLHSTERSRKLLGVVEVETGESVNNLEAMSQWAAFGRLRAPFHLYVPSAMIEVARRLCQDLQIPVAEIWTYHPVGDQMRFTLVHRAPGSVLAEKTGVPETTAEPRRSTPPARGRVESARTARRAGVTAAARRKAAPKARAAKAPARARPASAKKKAPARSARTQKRK